MSRYAQPFGAQNGSKTNTQQKTLSPIKYFAPNPSTMNGQNYRQDEGYEDRQSQSPSAAERRGGQSKILSNNWVGHNQKNSIPNRQRTMKLSQSPKGFSSSSIDSLGKSSKGDLSVGRLNALLLQTSNDNCYVSKYSTKKASLASNQGISSKRPSYSSKQSQQSDQSKVLTEQFRASNDQRINSRADSSNSNQQQQLHQQSQYSPKKTLEQQYRDRSPTKNWKDIEDEIKILKRVLKQDIAELNTSTISHGSSKENRSVNNNNTNNLKGMLSSPPSKRPKSNSSKSPAFVAQELYEENSRLKRMLEQAKIDWKTSLEETLEKEREEMRIVIDQYKEFIDKLLTDKRSLNSTLNQLKAQLASKESETAALAEANQELAQQINELKIQYNQLVESYEGLQSQYEQQNQLIKRQTSSQIDNINQQHAREEEVADISPQEQYSDQANGEIQIGNTQQEYQGKQQGQQAQGQLRQQSQQQQMFSKLEEVYRSQVDRIEEESQVTLHMLQSEYHSQQLSIGEETMRSSSQEVSKVESVQSNPEEEHIEEDSAERDITADKESTTDGLLVHLNSVINRISQEKIKIRDALKQNLTVNSPDTLIAQPICPPQTNNQQNTQYQQLLQQISHESNIQEKQQANPLLILAQYQDSQSAFGGGQQTQQQESSDTTQQQQHQEQISQANKISPQHNKPRVRSLNPFSQSPKQEQSDQTLLVVAKPAGGRTQQISQSNGSQSLQIVESSPTIPQRSSGSVDTQQHSSLPQGQQQQQQLKLQSTNTQHQQLYEQNLKEKFNQYYSNQQKKQDIQQSQQDNVNETQLRQVQPTRKQENQTQQPREDATEQLKSKSVPSLSFAKQSSPESANQQTHQTILPANSASNNYSSTNYSSLAQPQQKSQKLISSSPQAQSIPEKSISSSQNQGINTYPPVVSIPLQKMPPLPLSSSYNLDKNKQKGQLQQDDNVLSKELVQEDDLKVSQQNQLQSQQQQQLEIQSKTNSSTLNGKTAIINSNIAFTSEADIQKQYETIMLKIKEAQANQYKSRNTSIPDMFQGIEIDECLADNNASDETEKRKKEKTQNAQAYQEQVNEDSILTSHQFSFREHQQQYQQQKQ